MKNKKMIICLVALMLGTILPIASWAAIYYVSNTGDDTTGNGSISTPWATIDRGVEALRAGDTLYIRGGIYRESVTLPSTCEGTIENRITITAYQEEKVIMEGTELLSNWVQCQSDDPYLNIQGVGNSHYANIYKTRVHSSMVPAEVADLTVFEDGEYSRTARWPDQSLGYGENTDEMRFVPDEAFGDNNQITDNDAYDNTNTEGFWYPYIKDLTNVQLIEYWKNARVFIWFRSGGNYTDRFTIDGYENNAVTVNENYRRGLANGDKYSIEGHPHALDTPGEFYCSHEPDAEGYYTLYLWPRDASNLSSGISIVTGGTAIRAVHKKYITIKNLKIRGYRGAGIHFISDGGPNDVNNGAQVINCDISDCGGHGIQIYYADYALVQNCNIYRVGGFCVHIGGGINPTVKGCSVGNSDRTNIYMTGTDRGMITDNRIYGSSGVHGNGTACYTGNKKILIARNIYFNKANATLQNISDVVFFANIMDGQLERRSFLTTWGDSGNSTYPTQGYQIYMHNTLIRSDEPRHTVMSLPSQSENYLYNNLIGGSFSWDTNMQGRTHNGWVPISNQHTIPEPPLEGEWYLPRENPDIKTQYALIFTDVNTFDYTLVQNSPAIGAGRDLESILDDTTLSVSGTSIRQDFPDFDFGVDITGSPWGENPSMGAYEYGSVSIEPNTDPDPPSSVDPQPQPDPEPEAEIDPEPEIEEEAINTIPNQTLLRISNNVIKAGGNSAVNINCDVKDAGTLTVKIYDAKGREIITLWNKHEEPGTVLITWYGQDSGGSKVGSGIYLIHMECGGYSATKKVAVIK